MDLAHEYRLEKIKFIINSMIKDRDSRRSMHKKYQKAANVMDNLDNGLMSISILAGIGGVGILSTIVMTPIAIALEAAGVFCCILGIGSKLVKKNLESKAEKHQEIKLLCDSKINTIYDIVSMALKDGNINDEEFDLILKESEKFNNMKEEIRGKYKKP